MKNKGFSIIELLISVAVVGIMSALGVGAYTFYIPKAQSKEASQMMMHQMLELSSHMIKGACTANGNPLSIKGKYGILLVSGTPINSPGSSCPSGCNMQYTFGGVGVHNQLNGKVFVVDALNNGKLSQANGTTLAEKYWPAGISKLPVNAGDSCTAIAKTVPSTTEGSMSGNEVGDAEPTPPSPPTPTNPTPPTESATPPTGSGTPTPVPPPTTPIPPKGGGNELETVLSIDKDYLGLTNQDSGYFIKPSVNLYDFFVYKLNRAPKPAEKVTIRVESGVAVLGYGDVNSKPKTEAALVIDNRWNNVELNVANYGLVAGYGGKGGYNWRGAFHNGEDGGTAIANKSGIAVTVNNYNTIAGGGGGGSMGMSTFSAVWIAQGGSGGAPYGLPGYSGREKYGAVGGLLSGGAGVVEGKVVGYKECSRRACHGNIYLTGGIGGGLGLPGSDSIDIRISFPKSKTVYFPGKAGYVRTGNVKINNISSGVTRGR